MRDDNKPFYKVIQYTNFLFTYESTYYHTDISLYNNPCGYKV